ncbi:MAG: single-stranded DNA-binding protein [Agriterribacter sp.]
MNTNYVRLIGHLGNDLKVVNTKTGKMARIRLATTYKLKKPDSDGNTYGTVWHDVVAYGQKATYAESNLVKGSRVLVEGAINYRSYLDNGKHRRYVTEIKAQSLFNLDR